MAMQASVIIKHLLGMGVVATINHTIDADTAEYLVKEFGVQSNDAVSPLTGKLVVQEGNQIAIWADQADKLELTLSFLESLNG